MVVANLLNLHIHNDNYTSKIGLCSVNIKHFFLFDVFIYLYLGLVGGDETYKIEPPDPNTLSKQSVLQRLHRYKNKHDLKNNDND